MGRMWPSIWMLTRHHDRAHDMPGHDRAQPWPQPFIRYIVGTQLRVALSRDSKPGRLGRIYEAACWGRRGGVEPISLDACVLTVAQMRTIAAIHARGNRYCSRNSPQELVNQPASQLSGSVVFRQRPQKIFNLICKSRQQRGIFVWLRPSMPPGFHSISSDMIMLGIEEPLNHSFVCHRFPLSFLMGHQRGPALLRAPPKNKFLLVIHLSPLPHRKTAN